MTKHLLAFCAFALLAITSCRKAELADLSSVESSAERASAVAKQAVSAEEWKGYFEDVRNGSGLSIPYMDPDIYIADDIFIRNGTAMLQDIRSSEVSSFYSTFVFRIPDTTIIPGDNIALECAVQNLRSNSINNYDVVLELAGSLHSIQVHFVADSASVAQTKYSLGTITNSGLPSFVNYFGTFQKIKVTTKKGQTAVYIDNKLLYQFKYKADNKVGDIREIRLSGKGMPSFDYVKLTNSTTGRRRMTEDFNIEGQSHTVFY